MSDYFSKYQCLKFERPSDGVLLVTMNRPEARNALNPALHTEMARVWHDVKADDATRVVVITGAGKAFSIGGDPADMTADPAGPEEAIHSLHEVAEVVLNMVHLDKVVISAINGAAAAGGLAVALSADVTIISETAKLVDPHVLGGLVCGDHAALLWPLMCGMAKAKYYLLGAEVLDGREAERIGLVSQCVPADRVLPRALEIATRMAMGSQVAIRLTKRALNGWYRQAQPIFEHSVALEMLSLLHPDSREGVLAASQKRAPKFPSAGG
ncbi:MAG: enoyl-CoA hydratase/isomerase family protein [Gammaproteobacteria bacterium]